MKIEIGYGPTTYGTVEDDGNRLIYSGREDALRQLLEPMLAQSKMPPSAFLETLPKKLCGRTWAKIIDDKKTQESDDTADPAVQQVDWSPDNVDECLAEYRAQGVEYLKWLCQSNACDLCFANDGQVRKVGSVWPNGAQLPQCHPNCSCSVEPTKEISS